MKKLAVFSTLFVAMLVLTACENRNPNNPNQPPRDRNAPHGQNLPHQGDRDPNQRQ